MHVSSVVIPPAPNSYVHSAFKLTQSGSGGGGAGGAGGGEVHATGSAVSIEFRPQQS